MNLEQYADTITELAKRKKWGNDLAWLFYGCYKEMGELSIAIENNNFDGKTDIGSEFAGVMHYLLQLMRKVDPELNLDTALKAEIENNYRKKKKTYIKGRIVKR